MEERYDLCPPLKIPMSFAGNFGELRQTHFHSGVDFKTNGKEGYRVYSSEDGYVSRILVSASGYGNAVYITHPNGLVTVYGHLRNFNSKIAKHVRILQYKNENWEIDEVLQKELIKVKRGEKIGLSGNTGSSMGPHLHYEIRDVKTGDIVNPLLYFDAKDNIRPKISKLYVYTISDNAKYYEAESHKYKVVNNGRSYWLQEDTLHLCGRIGFGLKVKDFMNNSWNKFGLYTLKTYVNDSLVYYYKMDRFSFSNTKCVNLVKDMKEDMLCNSKVYKTWLPIKTNLNAVKYVYENGEVETKDGDKYNIRIEVSDLHQNKSVLKFVVKGIAPIITHKRKKLGSELYADRANIVECGKLRLEIPKGALYNNIDVDTEIYKSDDSLLYKPMVYRVGRKFIPMKKKFKVCIKVEDKFSSKKYIVRKEKQGKYSYVGGKIKNGELRAKTLILGGFAVKIDTVSPSIEPIRGYSKSWFKRHTIVRFDVKDEGTGVSNYRAEVNKQWVWCKYDAKKEQLICVFKKEQLTKGKENTFIVTVRDACNNKSMYKQSFIL